MIMISSKCLRTEFNGGLIDLCVLTGVSMREEKLAKKKKLDDNRKEADIFMNWMRRDRVYYTG